MASETLLALWNDTPTRRAIVDFVQAVSTEGSPGFVAPAERVAVFDNDGTPWSEKLIPIQLDGDRDFMRPFAHRIYGIPPERVIGSALGLDFDDSGDDTRLVYKSKIEFFDDGPAKPVRIWSRVGYRPLVAGGNSNGDIPMMRFARTGGREALRLLVLHDDADREFAYTTGAEDALDRAKTHGWTVVSMKEDWSAVFASA